MKNSFCSSPWFHVRIKNDGTLEECRWANREDKSDCKKLIDTDPIEWFQNGMSDFRMQMLAGEVPEICKTCQKMEQHNKISGRQRQLLKTGITKTNFEKSMLSSAWFNKFEQSYQNNGVTDQTPQDWQVDLGNYCNSGCLFCAPESSSKLASEFYKLNLITKMPARNWVDDPQQLEKFLNCIRNSKQIRYMHFIGGETLITPAFKTILQELVALGLNEHITIGFTTNLTVWQQDVVDLLVQFQNVNLGLSIECLHPVNEYARYGGDYETTKQLMDRWVALSEQHNWLTQIRTTPTILSIMHLHTIYDYAWRNKISVESCDFLEKPEFMRPTVLSESFRQQAIDNIQNWINTVDYEYNTDDLVNSRNPDIYQQVLLHDAKSYIDYLTNSADESFRLPDLVQYLKTMENNRNNSVLDYLPEYEKLFKSAGY